MFGSLSWLISWAQFDLLQCADKKEKPMNPKSSDAQPFFLLTAYFGFGSLPWLSWGREERNGGSSVERVMVDDSK